MSKYTDKANRVLNSIEDYEDLMDAEKIKLASVLIGIDIAETLRAFLPLVEKIANPPVRVYGTRSPAEMLKHIDDERRCPKCESKIYCLDDGWSTCYDRKDCKWEGWRRDTNAVGNP